MTGTLAIDVDGVLITGRIPDGAHWHRGLERDLGIDPDALRHAFFAPHWQRIVTGQIPMRPALTTALTRIAARCDADTLIDDWFATDARLNRPLLATLAEARAQGWRVVLATNQEPLRRAHLWDQMGLSAHADAIYASGDLGVAKPDPAFFAAVAARESGACRLLDGDPRNVRAARAAGWRAERVTQPDAAPQALHTLMTGRVESGLDAGARA